MSPFGFDASLILPRGQPERLDIGGSLQSGMALGDMIHRRQKEASVADAFRQSGGDMATLHSLLMQRGHGPEAFAAQDQVAQMAQQQAAANAQRAQMAKLIQEQEFQAKKHIGGLFYGADTPEKYAAARAQAPEEFRAHIPEQFDPTVAQRLGNLAISAEERAKMDQRDRHLRETLANRTRNAGIMAGQKAAADDAKVDSGKRRRYLEGYSLDPEAEPLDEEMKAIRKAQANARTMTATINEIGSIYKNHGNAVLPGPVRARLSALVTDLMLSAKSPEMYQLGVIAGPDMELLNKVAADPTSKESTVLDFFGDDQSMARLGTLRGQVLRRFESTARSLGFRPKSGKAAPKPAETPPAKTKVINGKAYTMTDDGGWEVDE